MRPGAFEIANHRMRTITTRCSVAAQLMLLAWSVGTQAASPSITANAGSGVPGDKATIEVLVDFGTGFEMISEDIGFQYDRGVLDFSATNSSVTIDGSKLLWPDYKQLLSDIGVVLENVDDTTAGPARKGYALSFAGEVERVGPMQMVLAFDILPGAPIGPTLVTFSGSVLANAMDEEFDFPAPYRSPGIAINIVPVPEPSQGILLIVGAGLLGALGIRTRS